MSNIIDSFTSVLDKIIGFLPNLIGAIVLLLIAWIIAIIVKKIIVKGLGALGFEAWLQKKGLVDDQGGKSNSDGIVQTFGKLAYFFIFLLFLPPVFDQLKMKAVSMPIKGMMTSMFNFAPKIVVAVIILIVGLFIAKILGTLVKNVLANFKVSRFNKYVNFGEDKNSIDIPVATGWIISTLVGLFFAVQALNTVNLTVLNKIGDAIIGYLPLVISGAIILALGFIGGNLIAKLLNKSTGNAMLAEIAKYLVIIVSVFMTLDQLHFAKSIVNVAFLLILGAVAVAFAIAFGIGGKSFAEQQLSKFSKKMESKNDNDRQ
ncbi:mechanosensitive ion channel [Staphylococcus sp. 18_1_E_LY]|uniref:Mechanosensitive ion channel n=1 Tax=Staphylococcus lloydii TaxID=2781774 RepID=A0A7T1B090_9STAP|nr:mechanosensitive ion channel [Staphylococcus lloydii]MBF7020006.1 mechanosensitive ion channel [Staphylococcus lloydii]MBF7027689.1 mechanosensitive ion channel [Staphylococcus lloydii]QPM75371.1 mechanosensitive ion channel [Staphylococcus lloydii]